MIVPTLGKYSKQEISWVFQKNSPYLNIFNFYFHKFKENGIWNSIEERYKIQPQVCPDLSGQPIEFSSCISAFLTLLLGFIISSFLMMIEFGKIKLLNKEALVLVCKKLFSGNSKILSHHQVVTESEIQAKISAHYDTVDDCLDKIDGLKIHLQHIRSNANYTENSDNKNQEEKV